MKSSRIGIRALREGLSSAIDRVRNGQVLEITDRGQPVARIVPVGSAGGSLVDLVALGKVRPPRSRGKLPRPLELPSRMTTEEAIDRLRGR